MPITVNEIINHPGGATDTYAEHLSQNPEDFFAVLDANLKLGKQYINRFSDPQIKALITKSYTPAGGNIAFFHRIKDYFFRYSPTIDRENFYHFKARVDAGYDAATGLKKNGLWSNTCESGGTLRLIYNMLERGFLIETLSDGKFNYQYKNRQGELSAPFFKTVRAFRVGQAWHEHPYCKTKISSEHTLIDNVFQTVVNDFITRQEEAEDEEALPLYTRLLKPLSAQGLDPEFKAPEGALSSFVHSLTNSPLKILLRDKKYSIVALMIPKISPQLIVKELLKEKDILPNLIEDIPKSNNILYSFFYILATATRSEDRIKILTNINVKNLTSLLQQEHAGKITVPTGLLPEMNNVFSILIQNQYYERATTLIQAFSPSRVLKEISQFYPEGDIVFGVIVHALPKTHTLMAQVVEKLNDLHEQNKEEFKAFIKSIKRDLLKVLLDKNIPAATEAAAQLYHISPEFFNDFYSESAGRIKIWLKNKAFESAPAMPGTQEHESCLINEQKRTNGEVNNSNNEAIKSEKFSFYDDTDSTEGANQNNNTQNSNKTAGFAPPAQGSLYDELLISNNDSYDDAAITGKEEKFSFNVNSDTINEIEDIDLNNNNNNNTPNAKRPSAPLATNGGDMRPLYKNYANLSQHERKEIDDVISALTKYRDENKGTPPPYNNEGVKHMVEEIHKGREEQSKLTKKQI